MSRKFTTLSSGDFAPFVNWPKDDKPTWVEGLIEGRWTNHHGAVLKLRVEAADPDLVAGPDKDISPVKVGDVVNVGLNLAGLECLKKAQVGSVVRIRFREWGETRGGSSFRKFKVEIAEDVSAAGPGLELDLGIPDDD